MPWDTRPCLVSQPLRATRSLSLRLNVNASGETARITICRLDQNGGIQMGGRGGSAGEFLPCKHEELSLNPDTRRKARHHRIRV
ncbi:rCG48816 [Rattus norvegicus]|uniref:RCG48816 n=1 Tax=Rattus norvegicus TaxID=10116 RepID=A6IG37_RAT|nr:rCG48816 [Rattus norvegicus]